MNKQIEEMANDLRKSEFWYFDDTDCDFELDRKKTAENLYNAGYRKVVRCKDCSSCDHRYPVKQKGEEAIEEFYCITHKRCVKPDDFCSFAKLRKEMRGNEQI